MTRKVSKPLTEAQRRLVRDTAGELHRLCDVFESRGSHALVDEVNRFDHDACEGMLLAALITLSALRMREDWCNGS